jgi:hypothetical protein
LLIKQLVHHVILNEGVSLFDVLRRVDVSGEQPPEAADEVCYHENNQDQPENLVGVHDDVETLESVSPRRILIIGLDHSLKPGGIQNGDEFRQSHETNHPGVLSL